MMRRNYAEGMRKSLHDMKLFIASTLAEFQNKAMRQLFAKYCCYCSGIFDPASSANLDASSFGYKLVKIYCLSI
jgi:hypothetical protein